MLSCCIMMKEADSVWPPVDRQAFSVTSVSNETEDTAYWHARTPQERLRAAELNRQVVYGYGLAPPRFQRVLEVIKLAPS